MAGIFDNKTVLVTGGTGSFGQNFVEMLLKKHNPRMVRVYGRGELKHVEMKRKINGSNVQYFIGDVRDRERLYRAMNDVDIVVDAAALKHVPVCEDNPIEAIKTNVNGPVNVIDAAIDNSVEKVVTIGTDKSVHPINLYGATKLVAEKLYVQANAHTEGKKTKFSVVRYGNVLGSSGSVIPLFLEQMVKGEITITDERMTRFWITLDQGASFVSDSIKEMKGGEIFVPKIPSMKIIDLADALAPKARKKVIGIRPGEKLHEVLLTADEAMHSKEFGDHFIIEPEHPFWNKSNHPEGKRPSPGFTYASDNNSEWLDKEQLRKILKGSGIL